MPHQNIRASVIPASRSCNAPELEAVFEKIADLRQIIISAWQERGVTFTSSEQRQLREEIEATALLLHDLTLHA